MMLQGKFENNRIISNGGFGLDSGSVFGIHGGLLLKFLTATVSV